MECRETPNSHASVEVLKKAGGLGVPDIRRYYRAIDLQRILNWRFHTQSWLWVPLEKCLTGRTLVYAPWLPGEHRGLSDTTSPLTFQALKFGIDLIV